MRKIKTLKVLPDIGKLILVADGRLSVDLVQCVDAEMGSAAGFSERLEMVDHIGDWIAAEIEDALSGPIDERYASGGAIDERTGQQPIVARLADGRIRFVCILEEWEELSFDYVLSPDAAREFVCHLIGMGFDPQKSRAARDAR